MIDAVSHPSDPRANALDIAAQAKNKERQSIWSIKDIPQFRTRKMIDFHAMYVSTPTRYEYGISTCNVIIIIIW